MPTEMKQCTAGRGRSGLPSHTPVCCGKQRCLGPMAFHTGSVGAQIALSQGSRRAERAWSTFQNAVAFSSRPVKVKEKMRLRVEICDLHWAGVLRLGFTTVPPSPAAPPAAMAIPNLTDKPGYWVAIVPESHSTPGSEMRFWVDSKGRVVLEGRKRLQNVLLEGVDIRQKLWAVFDVYGQTRAVLLLGSEKKGIFSFLKKKSCATPPPPPVSQKDSCLCVSKSRPFHKYRTSLPQQQQQQLPVTPPTGLQLEDCIVCMSAGASAVLSCGHQCLCLPCATRVATELGSCPLCRRSIDPVK